jgi:hypothetical protein
MENITNSAFVSEDLTDATGGGANYRLQAVGTFTIGAINDPTLVPGGGASNVDISFSGTVNVYETTDPLEAVNFTTDTFASATAKVVAGDFLATLTTDFGILADIPDGQFGLTAFPGVNARAGFTLTASALGFSIVPDGTDIEHRDFATGALVTTSHDLTLNEQFFLNTGANSDDFPFFTDTTVQFTVPGVIPEPVSLIVWFGLAAIGWGLARKKLK